MIRPRSSGILLHPTSLPGTYGIGDLGPQAHGFLEFLAETGQRWWQVLPLGPVGPGDSPYQSPSSFAGNPLLISPELLANDGLIAAEALGEYPTLSHDRVDFPSVRASKNRLLELAFQAFDRDDSDFLSYQRENAAWLDDYSLYVALEESYAGRPWYEWPAELARREPEALSRAREDLERDRRVTYVRFQQYIFDRQWTALRDKARSFGIQIIGDVPIYVALESADVWANPHLFELDEGGRPTAVAGVPPDFFNAAGQHWGNPLYRWDAHQVEGYRWWTERLKSVLQRVDLVRLDHFRGFQAYWAIPAGAPDARHGHWREGPDPHADHAPFLGHLRTQFQGLPLIAEDLGHITHEVHALRERFEVPGMKVLQFAFNGGPDHPYLPHNFPRNTVVYTGTHDTDTIVGWFRGGELREEHPREWLAERAAALRYLGTDGRQIHWDMIRSAFASVAQLAICPLQDILGLGFESRMNVPGVATGNWGWRYHATSIDRHCRDQLTELTWVYDRWNEHRPRPVLLPRHTGLAPAS